jgi:hypothetical protein
MPRFGRPLLIPGPTAAALAIVIAGTGDLTSAARLPWSAALPQFSLLITSQLRRRRAV